MNPCFRAVGHLAFCASMFCLGVPSAHAEPAATFLRPDLKVGERLSDVFSKTVSTRGAGFEEKVDRISGTADYTVTDVTAKAIVFDEDDRYDGYPARGPLHKVEILRDGITNCYAGKCRINDQTSGVVFNPLLWGKAPDPLRAGMSWDVAIPAPWEIGPAGAERVRCCASIRPTGSSRCRVPATAPACRPTTSPARSAESRCRSPLRPARRSRYR